MPALTQAQIDELTTLSDKTFAQFSNADAIRYWQNYAPYLDMFKKLDGATIEN